MRQIVGMTVLGIVIAAIAAPIAPLAIATLDLADLHSRLWVTGRRLLASDLDQRGLVRSPLTRVVPLRKSGQATAVSLIC